MIKIDKEKMDQFGDTLKRAKRIIDLENKKQIKSLQDLKNLYGFDGLKFIDTRGDDYSKDLLKEFFKNITKTTDELKESTGSAHTDDSTEKTKYSETVSEPVSGPKWEVEYHYDDSCYKGFSTPTEITEGSVVNLKSGSQDMTAMYNTRDALNNWLCKWFYDGILYEGYFTEKSLKLKEN